MRIIWLPLENNFWGILQNYNWSITFLSPIDACSFIQKRIFPHISSQHLCCNIGAGRSSLSEKIYSCKANLGIFWVRIHTSASVLKAEPTADIAMKEMKNSPPCAKVIQA